jgi:hypothetical protein
LARLERLPVPPKKSTAVRKSLHGAVEWLRVDFKWMDQQISDAVDHTRRRQHRRLCDVRHRQLKAVLKAAAAEGCAQGSGVPKAVLKGSIIAQGSKACRRPCLK